MKLPFKQFILALLMAAAISGNVFAQKVNFEPADSSGWTRIMARSKALNRLVFVEVYSDSSHISKLMDEKTLNDASLTDHLNVAFVNVRFNIDSPAGMAFAKKYQVGCLPAFIFLDWDGNSVIQRGSGFYTAKQLLDLSQSVATPEVKTYSAAAKEFHVPHPTADAALKYLKFMSENCMPTNDTAVKFLTSKRDTDNLLPKHWEIIKTYVTDIQSAPFKYLVSRRSSFISKYGHDEVEAKIFDSYLNKGKEIIYLDKADKGKYTAYKNTVTAVVFDRNKELGLTLDWVYADATANWKNYYNLSGEMIKKYKGEDAAFLNTVSRKLIDYSKSKKVLKELLQWAQKSTQIKANWENEDTYAKLLFKTGDKDRALESEMKAIEFAKSDGADTVSLVKTRDLFTQSKSK